MSDGRRGKKKRTRTGYGHTLTTCVRAGRALWSARDNGCCITWSRNEAANWGGMQGRGGESVLCPEQIVC